MKLTSEQLQKLLKIVTNEYVNYTTHYHFFKTNCSTEIQQILIPFFPKMKRKIYLKPCNFFAHLILQEIIDTLKPEKLPNLQKGATGIHYQIMQLKDGIENDRLNHLRKITPKFDNFRKYDLVEIIRDQFMLDRPKLDLSLIPSHQLALIYLKEMDLSIGLESKVKELKGLKKNYLPKMT